MDRAGDIARGLTKVEASAMVQSHWSARHVGGLFRKGLVYWSTGPHGRKIIKFRQLGLAVRNHLEARDD